MMRQHRTTGRQSIWEYPRTPAVEPTPRRIQVVHRNCTIADTTRARRVLEMGHPPNYYIPPEAIRLELLEPTDHTTFCEWKGIAVHFDLYVGDEVIESAAWYYPEPTRRYEAIRDFVAFYPQRVDACMVDGEVAKGESNPFYGGWITSEIEGPFR